MFNTSGDTICNHISGKKKTFFLRQLQTKIADMVDEHVRFEERVLFPHLERKLSEEQLESIGSLLQKHHPSLLQDQYEDRFWNIK
jgi:hemerythrin-like domain-containing protein